jgi:hypothetical protein
MAKMRDLVWRNSLRKRGFGDLDVLTPHVFEVKGLDILAGTDWSGDPADPEDPNPPYLLGSFDYAFQSGGFIVFGYIETAGDTDNDQDIALRFGTAAGASGGDARTMGTGGFWNDYIELFPGHFFFGGVRSEPAPEPISMKVWLATSIGGVSADVSVVSARAAFFVP